jgi:uncharacterized protein YbjT (DUF2867 family)
MYVVAGVTGNTGSAVVQTLLAEKKPVRVIVRDAAKGEAFRARGADVAVASLDDAEALRRAFAGATGAYLLLPPNYAAKDTLADRRRLVDAYLQAIPGSGLSHVVFLSSFGAQHATGTGVIRTLNDAEVRLGKLDVPITFLRAGYFLENFASVLAPVKGDGVLPSFVDPTLPLPLVAAKDIGRTAARLLLEGPSAGRVVELSGPKDASHEDVAAAFAKLLGRPVNVVRVPEEAMVPALVQAGLGEDLATLYAEMNVGIQNGKARFEGKGVRPIRGTITVDEALSALLSGASG